MNNIPTSPRQLLTFALVMLGPMVLAMAAICWAPAKPGHTPSDTWTAAVLVGAATLLLGALVAASAFRHAIVITPATLTVKHSVYTLTLSRADVTSATVRELRSIGEAGLTARKFGTAILGYYSGWFWGARGALTFCAVSATPLYLVTLEGSAPCRQLVLSAGPDIARDIAAWAAG